MYTLLVVNAQMYIFLGRAVAHCSSDDLLRKGGGKRGHIVAHDASWVGKRVGHKTLCPCHANGETFVADTKMFLTTNVVRNKCCVHGQTGKH